MREFDEEKPSNAEGINGAAGGSVIDAPLKAYRIVGIDVAPPATASDAAARLRQVQSTFAGPQPNLAHLRAPPPAARPIYADEAGDYHVLLPREDGSLVAIPWLTSQKTDVPSLSNAKGGFLPLDALRRVQPGRPDPALAHVAKLLASRQDPASAAAPAHGDGGAPAAVQLLGATLSYAPQLYGLLAGGGATGGGSLGDTLQSFCDNPSSLLDSLGPSLAGMGVNQLVGMAGQQLMSALFPLTDSSSLGAQLAAKAAQEVMGELQAAASALLMDAGEKALGALGLGNFGSADASTAGGGGSTDRVNKYLSSDIPGWSWSAATLQAVRMNDVDAKGNKVVAGLPTVLVEGMPLARLGDPMDKTGVQVYLGAATVEAGGQLVARMDSLSGAPAPFATHAAATFVGGPVGGAPPSPASPPSVRNSGAKAGSGSASGASSKAGGRSAPQEGAEGGGSGEREAPHHEGESEPEGEEHPLRDAATDAADGVKEAAQDGHAMEENEKTLKNDEQRTKDYESEKSKAEANVDEANERLRGAEESHGNAKSRLDATSGSGTDAASANEGTSAGEELNQSDFNLSKAKEGVQSANDDLSNLGNAPSATASMSESTANAIEKGGKIVGAAGTGLDLYFAAKETYNAAAAGHPEESVPIAMKTAGGWEGASAGAEAGLLFCALLDVSGPPGVVVDLLCGAGGAVVGGFIGRKAGEGAGNAIIGKPEAEAPPSPVLELMMHGDGGRIA